LPAIPSPQPFWIGPNTAFVLAIFGVLGIYCEFIWPGRLIPGLLGAAALAVGSYYLYRLSPSRLSVVLISAAALLFMAECLWKTFFIAGALGTTALAAGFCTMFRNPPWIVAGLAIPVCSMFGAVTCFLCYAARTARASKWADVDGK